MKVLGRKRTSNKVQISISVDENIIKKLRELEANRSLIFTNAAEKFIREYEQKTENKKKTN